MAAAVVAGPSKNEKQTALIEDLAIGGPRSCADQLGPEKKTIIISMKRSPKIDNNSNNNNKTNAQNGHSCRTETGGGGSFFRGWRGFRRQKKKPKKLGKNSVKPSKRWVASGPLE